MPVDQETESYEMWEVSSKFSNSEFKILKIETLFCELVNGIKSIMIKLGNSVWQLSHTSSSISSSISLNGSFQMSPLSSFQPLAVPSNATHTTSLAGPKHRSAINIPRYPSGTQITMQIPQIKRMTLFRSVFCYIYSIDVYWESCQCQALDLLSNLSWVLSTCLHDSWCAHSVCIQSSLFFPLI